MISIITNPSNLTKHTYSDDVLYVKGIKPFTVGYARLEITIGPIILGIVYTSPQ